MLQGIATLFLDARGVIRYKIVRGAALDRAVDALLAETKSGTARPR